MPKASEKKNVQTRRVNRKPGAPVDTPQLRDAFLKVLAETGNVGVASEAIGVYRTTPYQWKRKDPDFAKAWDEALDAAADVAEAEVRRRGIDGWYEPVYYQGKEVGRILKYSDRMLELHMKALKPEKYREKSIPDSSVVIQIGGIEEINKLRVSQPWQGDTSVSEGDETESFKPLTLEVAPNPPRVAAAIEAQSKNNKGLTEAEREQEEDN